MVIVEEDFNKCKPVMRPDFKVGSHEKVKLFIRTNWNKPLYIDLTTRPTITRYQIPGANNILSNNVKQKYDEMSQP